MSDQSVIDQNGSGKTALNLSTTFSRYGQSSQLRIESAADLKEILTLDEALWAATAAPTGSFEVSDALLHHIDAASTGRIRAAEVSDAVRWLLAHIKESEIQPGNTTLNLEAVIDSGADAAAIRTVSAKLLQRFNSDTVSLTQVQKVLAEAKVKGPKTAGAVSAQEVMQGADAAAKSIIDVEAEAEADINADDNKDATGETLNQLVHDIAATTQDKPGDNPTITQEELEQFFAEAKQMQRWRQAGESIIRPLGDKSAQAVSLFNELKPKIDGYFTVCAATAIDPSLNARWQLPEPGSEHFAAHLAAAPLARPKAGSALPLKELVNPVWSARLARFAEQAIAPLLGEQAELSEAQWHTLQTQLASYREWYTQKPDVRAQEIPAARLRRWLENKQHREQLEQKLAESRRALVGIQNLQAVEKLLLFQSALLGFCRSFVSFPDLYIPENRALFEMGTLIMDGRRFNFAVRLADRAQHVKFSESSNMYVLYVEITGDDEKPIYEVVVPVTSGTRGNLQVGKRGIFHDTHGNEFHARVVQLVAKPISLREAIAAPFLALSSAITAKVEGLANSAKEKFVSQGSTAVENAATNPSSLPASVAKPAVNTPAKPAVDSAASNNSGGSGFLAGGGLAIAALASSAAFITKTLASLSILKIFTGIATAIVLVVIPVTILAWIRLRRRDLSSILEGSGWAINARMRLSRRQAHNFTVTPSAGVTLPGIGSREDAKPKLLLLTLLIAIALFFAHKNGWLEAITQWL